MTFPHEHHYLLEDKQILSNARKSTWVFILTATMMVIEISAGYFTHSMALLADGWHMASHAAAMVISLLAYKLGRSSWVNKRLSFGTGKIIPLGGYSSALILTMISILMAEESIRRLLNPQLIHFNEAIGVAVLGLLINFISALVLEHRGGSYSSRHHDHNIRSAYVHVLADALTSIFAIIALSAGKFFGLNWMDPVMGMVGSVIILKWAYELCQETASELLDVHSKQLPPDRIRNFLETKDVQVLDIHTWRVAPNAVACELVVASPKLLGGDYYREIMKGHFHFEHLIIEERLTK